MDEFLAGFGTIAQQVIVLFLLIGVGFVCGRTRKLNTEAVKGITEIVLVFAAPCMIIRSFQRAYDPVMLKGLLIALAAALGVHLLAIVLAHLVFRDADVARRRVLRFGTVFSNAGYMGLPLQQAVLGEDGVFYGAAFITIFNLVLWSYGLLLMSGDRRNLSPRKMLLNPGVIGVLLGLPVFLFSVSLPEVAAVPITHLANLNTPLPMIVVGFYLADAHLMDALRDKRSYVAIALRLVVVPALTLGGLYLCGVRGSLLVALVIAASAPMAAATTMFATKFEQDTTLSVNLVSVSTLLSLVTMPLLVSVAGMWG